MSRGQLLDITNEKNASRWLAGCPDQVPEIESAHASFVNHNDIPRQEILLVVARNESHGLAHLAGIRIERIIELGVEAEHPMNGRSVERRVGKECVSTSSSRCSPFHLITNNFYLTFLFFFFLCSLSFFFFIFFFFFLF